MGLLNLCPPQQMYLEAAQRLLKIQVVFANLPDDPTAFLLPQSIARAHCSDHEGHRSSECAGDGASERRTGRPNSDPEGLQPRKKKHEEISNTAGEREEVLIGDVDEELLDGEETIIAAVPVNDPDNFVPMDERSDEVVELVKQFMEQYEEEVGRTALKASVLQVLKAEKTESREEVHEIEIGTGQGEENNLKLVETDVSQLIRAFLLVDYGFQTSVMDSKRPYVSVLRLTLDCANDTIADEQDMECDLLEHLDLPRHKGEVGKAIQRTIADAAPASFLATHSLHVKYDAVELQDIATDEDGGIETMTYVRYRVADSSGKFAHDDCMVVIQQARGINTLMYTDTVCFESASKSAVMAAYEYASNNVPVGALIFAAICGALIAVFVLFRHRRKKQRFGYSYVRSKASHVPTQGATTGVKYVDAESPAIAC